MILLQAGLNPQLMNVLFIGGMILIFYFFMIRPQQQKQKKQKEFASSVKKGDDVVTIGGMYGKIASSEGDTVLLEVDRGVKIRMDKSSISFENTALLKKKNES
ncbi:preprotein translocase subunit YajC [Flammeovirgaceae bacterium SG7u.111]|nr:preprotein translocase subunit YajC [Flammeovirgaceae bacterium SG7u.132]WPO35521.1 preprotein translocase subunit YajC [Flammeovirgaceae bacterium SG7u.111]